MDSRNAAIAADRGLSFTVSYRIDIERLLPRRQQTLSANNG